MSFLGRIGSFFSLHEDIEEDEFQAVDEPQAQAQQAAPRRNVVPFGRRQEPGSAAEVAVFAPRGFADVTEIADSLRNRQVVIINLQGADRGLLQRVVDFTSGVAYTIDGRIQKLADAIYLVVPSGVNVNSAGLRDSIENDGILDLAAKFNFGNGARG